MATTEWTPLRHLALTRIAEGRITYASRPSGRWEFRFGWGTTAQERGVWREAVDELMSAGAAKIREYDRYRADVALTDTGRGLLDAWNTAHDPNTEES
jgi:hypothetical protein